MLRRKLAIPRAAHGLKGKASHGIGGQCSRQVWIIVANVLIALGPCSSHIVIEEVVPVALRENCPMNYCLGIFQLRGNCFTASGSSLTDVIKV